MGVLVVRCPTRGRYFSTGIQTDADSFARMKNEATQTRCPYCLTEHSWRPLEQSSLTPYRQLIGLKIRNSARP